MSESAEGGGPNNEELGNRKNSPEPGLPDDGYDLTDRGKLNATERRMFTKRANDELQLLLKSKTPDKSTSVTRHQERDRKREAKAEQRNHNPKVNKNAKYELPKGVDEESHLPDRLPELDPNLHESFNNAIVSIMERLQGRPELATLEDLNTIIKADMSDRAMQNDSYKRLTRAIPVAKEYLMNRKNPRRVNVSVVQDEKGEWIAQTGAKKGKLYLTFTGSRIIDARTEILQHFIGLDMLDEAEIALNKMIGKKNLNEYSKEAQALNSYLRGNAEVLRARKSKIKDKDQKAAADLAISLFDNLLGKANKYKTALPKT